MPTPGDVHVNGPLTNLSIGYMQSQDAFVADKVFPVVPVEKASDLFYKYDFNEWNKGGAKERAPNTESAGSDFGITTDSYSAKVYGFHKDVSDQYRKNADATIDPDKEATDFVSQRMLISREITFANNFMATGKWTYQRAGDDSGSVGSGEVTKWSDYTNSDPITDVADAATAIQKKTGFRPNKLVIARPVFDKLKNHPDFIDRVKYGQTPGQAAKMTRQAMAELFEVDEVLVMEAVLNSAGDGLSASTDFLVSASALLVYAAPAPGLMTPSGGYTFNWRAYTGGKAIAVSKFRMEHLKSDRIEGEMAWDQKLVAADLGAFFSALI